MPLATTVYPRIELSCYDDDPDLVSSSLGILQSKVTFC